MIWLVLGVLLWAGAHLFKRLLPKVRAGLGDMGRGLIAAASVVALVLMVIGYRSVDLIVLWQPPRWGSYGTAVLMVIAVPLFVLARVPGAHLKRYLRHPMLLSVLLWAVAHLLVRGDLGSLVLFGGLGLWAVAEIMVINRAQPRWRFTGRASLRGDAIWIAASVITYAAIVLVHGWIGPSPFPA